MGVINYQIFTDDLLIIIHGRWSQMDGMLMLYAIKKDVQQVTTGTLICRDIPHNPLLPTVLISFRDVPDNSFTTRPC